ncbi:MAG TPA: glucosaminidase domain-containing protein [Acetobacteraceae bacterium]|nr:glucosaminidase domain-containing protein [Acetobacteraceae bacterium]
MLTASVGQGGENRPDDVRLVQSLLNARRPGGFPLSIDGVCGLSTITAIRRFQGQAMGLPRPDGLVTPGGLTLCALAPVAPRVPAAVPREPIPESVVAAAQAAEQAWGVPAAISIAQWILESGRGAHMPPGSNNPFGIKAATGQPYVTAQTREVFDGKEVVIAARFRKFPSLEEAFAEHGRLLATFPPYRQAMAAEDDDQFAERLTGTYATDPNYGSALKAIMQGSNLYAFDRPRRPVTSPS